MTKRNQIIFLGTGTSQGVPLIGCKCPICKSSDPKDKRFRTSAFVYYNGIKILIDCGVDFRQQMLKENLCELDLTLITHEHADHILGLDDLRPIYFIDNKNIKLYANQRTIDDIRLKFSYAFSENKYPGTPGFDLFPVKNLEQISILGEKIIPFEVIHGKLPILGYRIGSLGYITDASFIADTSLNIIKDLDILVINSLREKEHHSHFCLNESLEIIEKTNPKSAYLTHISHDMGFYETVSKILPKNVFLAYDGLRVDF